MLNPDGIARDCDQVVNGFEPLCFSKTPPAAAHFHRVRGIDMCAPGAAFEIAIAGEETESTHVWVAFAFDDAALTRCNQDLFSPHEVAAELAFVLVQQVEEAGAFKGGGVRSS